MNITSFFLFSFYKTPGGGGHMLAGVWESWAL